MKRIAAQLTVTVVAAFASGCAPYLTPYGARPGYSTGRPFLPSSANADAGVRGRWDKVMRLPRNAQIDVLTWDGVAHVGWFASADGSSLRLMNAGREDLIPRDDIVRVDLVDLPGSEAGAVAKRAGRGALLGMGAMALITGVIGGDAWPPPAAALRAGAAYGAVVGGQQELLGRRGGLVYLSENLRPH